MCGTTSKIVRKLVFISLIISYSYIGIRYYTCLQPEILRKSFVLKYVTVNVKKLCNICLSLRMSATSLFIDDYSMKPWCLLKLSSMFKFLINYNINKNLLVYYTYSYWTRIFYSHVRSVATELSQCTEWGCSLLTEWNLTKLLILS